MKMIRALSTVTMSGARAGLLSCVCGLVLMLGCQSSTSPADAPDQYSQLVQRAVAQAEGRPDTSFFWLTNTGDPRARTLMLDLGLEYLRYDRSADALCVWSGEGLQPAEGYATGPSGGRLSPDSVGLHCNIEGTCTGAAVTDRWIRFRCE